jgi:hypothetical protein
MTDARKGLLPVSATRCGQYPRHSCVSLLPQRLRTPGQPRWSMLLSCHTLAAERAAAAACHCGAPCCPPRGEQIKPQAWPHDLPVVGVPKVKLQSCGGPAEVRCRFHTLIERRGMWHRTLSRRSIQSGVEQLVPRALFQHPHSMWGAACARCACCLAPVHQDHCQVSMAGFEACAVLQARTCPKH